MRIGRAAMTAAALGLLAGGCGPPALSDERVGELAATFSQADTGRAWVGELVGLEPFLVATREELGDWIASLPDDAGDGLVEELAAIDLTDRYLVVGAYPRCTESSSVIAHETDGVVEVMFRITADDPNIDCAWSPLTVDVWAVRLAETGGVVPDAVSWPEDRGNDG